MKVDIDMKMGCTLTEQRQKLIFRKTVKKGTIVEQCVTAVFYEAAHFVDSFGFVISPQHPTEQATQASRSVPDRRSFVISQN